MVYKSVLPSPLGRDIYCLSIRINTTSDITMMSNMRGKILVVFLLFLCLTPILLEGGRPGKKEGQAEKSEQGKKEAAKPSGVEAIGGRNETHAGGRNETHGAQGRNETHAGGRNETHAGERNETHAGGPNETHAGGPNETHAGGPNETHAGGRNENHAGGRNENHAGGRNENHADEPNETHTDDHIKTHQHFASVRMERHGGRRHHGENPEGGKKQMGKLEGKDNETHHGGHSENHHGEYNGTHHDETHGRSLKIKLVVSINSTDLNVFLVEQEQILIDSFLLLIQASQDQVSVSIKIKSCERKAQTYLKFKVANATEEQKAIVESLTVDDYTAAFASIPDLLVIAIDED